MLLRSANRVATLLENSKDWACPGLPRFCRVNKGEKRSVFQDVSSLDAAERKTYQGRLGV